MRRRAALFFVVAAIGMLATGSVANARGSTVTLTARLSGAQEVPAADPDGRGTAVVFIDVAKGRVCFILAVAGPGRRTAATSIRWPRA